MKALFSVILITIFGTIFSQNPNFVLFDHTNSPLIDDNITWVESDSNNVKWIGTTNGLYSFDNNVWTWYNTSNSNIPTDIIDTFKIGYDNTIWFTNANNGFYKLKNNVFTLYNQSNLSTLPSENFNGLAIDSNDVFLYNKTNGIVKFNSSDESVLNINTSNSFLQKIDKLVYHSNHTLYGISVGYPVLSGPGTGTPLTFIDSVERVQNFTIINSTTLSINYCFSDYNSICSYNLVFTDKYKNRFELINLSTAQPPTTNQRLRRFDATNNLISDDQYNQNPEKQFAINNYGKYTISHSGADFFDAIIFNPPSAHSYFGLNSIIPSPVIINFDVDKINNVWLATPKGLVVYNDIGVVTNVIQSNSDKNAFTVYPNPTNSILNIMPFDSAQGDKQEVKIINMLGDVVASTTLSNQQSSINISHLNCGVYFIELKMSNDIVRKKIVKE